MPRIRTKTSFWNFVDSISTGGPGGVSGQYTSEYFAEDRYPGSCQCSHWSEALPITGIASSPEYPYHPWKAFGFPVGFYSDEWSLAVGGDPSVKQHGLSLNWDKLPTSSQFGIIQFIAELDDTIALFTSKFWRSLSYGSVTWGVEPFVADCQELLKTLSNLFADLGDFPYEDSHDWRYTRSGTDTTRPLVIDVEAHLSGRISYPGGDDILAAYDRLGFHPDLATVWDLIPLSFVVDYLLPIGDLLEALSPRGWVRTVNFTGWQVLKQQITAPIRTSWNAADQKYFNSGPRGTLKSFSRNRLMSAVLEIPETAELPALELPSPRQIFNMLYLLLARGKK